MSQAYMELVDENYVTFLQETSTSLVAAAKLLQDAAASVERWKAV